MPHLVPQDGHADQLLAHLGGTQGGLAGRCVCVSKRIRSSECVCVLLSVCVFPSVCVHVIFVCVCAHVICVCSHHDGLLHQSVAVLTHVLEDLVGSVVPGGGGGLGRHGQRIDQSLRNKTANQRGIDTKTLSPSCLHLVCIICNSS